MPQVKQVYSLTWTARTGVAVDSMVVSTGFLSQSTTFFEITIMVFYFLLFFCWIPYLVNEECCVDEPWEDDHSPDEPVQPRPVVHQVAEAVNGGHAEIVVVILIILIFILKNNREISGYKGKDKSLHGGVS